MSDRAWEEIFRRYKIATHNFDNAPFAISAAEIKNACQHFSKVSEKEVRILCKQDSREKRPQVFKDKGLFILPVRNGRYVLVRGEGYVDIPPVTAKTIPHRPALDFPLDTATAGDSEMQHLDYAYAASLVRTFTGDDSLVLGTRGRKFTPEFSFRAGKFDITAKGVQTEVDGGYEGRDQIALVEAKNAAPQNTIIRQLYYPFRQWSEYSRKAISVIFFMHKSGEYHFWRFGFSDKNDYNSIYLANSARYRIEPPPARPVI